MLPHLSRHRSDPEQSASFLRGFSCVGWCRNMIFTISERRAIVFATEKFEHYICGRHVIAENDHHPYSWTSWRRSRRLQLDSSWQVHVCHWWAVTRISIPYEQTSRSPRVICRHLRAYPLATAWASGKQLQDRRITRRNRSMSEMLKSADSCAIDSLSNNRRGR